MIKQKRAQVILIITSVIIIEEEINTTLHNRVEWLFARVDLGSSIV